MSFEKFSWLNVLENNGIAPTIYNQGSLNACWAFAACAQAEFLYALQHRTKIELSSQQVIDFSPFTNDALWSNPNRGILYMLEFPVTNENLYPYRGDYILRPSPSDPATEEQLFGNTGIKLKLMCGQRIRNLENLPSCDLFQYEVELMNMVSIQPILAGFQVNEEFQSLQGQEFWSGFQPQFDDSGRFRSEWGTFGHVMLITGFGTDLVFGNYINYWEVLNSFGPEWGRNGIIKIFRSSSIPPGLIDPLTCWYLVELDNN